jgi:nucleoid-associated protein YgaU
LSYPLEENTMADLEQLKQKYAPVIQMIQSFSDLGAAVEAVSLDGDKLYLKAAVPSQVVANRVWDTIKQVDPQYADLHHEIATSGGPNQTYTVKSGDNLSNISKRFYGTASDYPKIAAASNIADANLIRVGQQITIPAL